MVRSFPSQHDPERKEDRKLKENYEALEMNVVVFNSKDVITTSGGIDDGDED